MIQVEEREAIRRANFVEHKSIRAIARELKHGRDVIREALASAEPCAYTRKSPLLATRLGACRAAIDALLAENDNAPHKQHYTARNIFQQLNAQGYTGNDVTVRHGAQQRQSECKRLVFLPFEFDPGPDAQVDWSETEAIQGGQWLTVRFFELRHSYSRKVFARAYPAQKQDVRD
jgi:transposase